ncbi:hypothetical protein [Clostridium sp. Ade.TY]|uniref:hypothetical protein n=1 Tax=Clostridium sp. Ade.TY TaxID=1391647 RepID=UPI00040F730E|nr:hypothetical protein [Clostridium sp. Ade.TY]
MKRVCISILILIISFVTVGCSKEKEDNLEKIRTEIKEELKVEFDKEKEKIQEDFYKEKEKLQENLEEKIRKEIEEKNKNELNKPGNIAQSKEENSNEKKLDEAFKKQYFLKKDSEGRDLFQKDQTLDSLLKNNLNIPYKYQPFLDQKGNKGISIKICFKDLGGSDEYYKESRNFLNIMHNFRLDSGADIQSLYIYNLDNSANMIYEWYGGSIGFKHTG